jgi:hypothetical protein
MGASLPRRLLLEGAERSKLTLRVDDLFHSGDTESADQFVLQVCDAHVKTQLFHIHPREVGAEAGPLETALELALLGGVTETSEPDIQALRTEQIQEVSYRLRASDRHDENGLRVKIAAATLSEGFERELVADSFNEHHRMWVDACGPRMCCGDTSRIRPACRSLLLSHVSYFSQRHA